MRILDEFDPGDFSKAELCFAFEAANRLDHFLERIIESRLKHREVLDKMKNWFLEQGFDSFAIQLDFHYLKLEVATAEERRLLDNKESESDIHVSIPISVNDHCFGEALLCVEKLKRHYSMDFLRFCSAYLFEQIDNVLYMRKMNYLKKVLIDRVQAELHTPNLEKGLELTLAHVKDLSRFQHMVLIFKDPHFPGQQVTQYLVFLQDRLMFSTSGTPLPSLEELLKNSTESIFEIQDYELAKLMACEGVEARNLYDPATSRRVGRLFLTSEASDGISAFEADLVDIIGQGVEEVLKLHYQEKHVLVRHFCAKTSARILRTKDYPAILDPKEMDCGILYADVSGFTHLSEQILRDPKTISDFVEEWSNQVMKIFYKYNGVYDKLVGDCMIGLFGPPFFDRDSSLLKEDMVCCALEVAEMTNAMNSKNVYREYIRVIDPDFRIGVAIGINYAPLFVGRIGPGKSYTGLSAGMNNTARLQGLAKRDQILYMHDMNDTVRKMNLKYNVSKRKSAKVKNVSEPLEYHEIDVSQPSW